jgi:hypothetical protein
MNDLSGHVLLKACWSNNDINTRLPNEMDEDPYWKSKCTMSDILSTALKIFDTNKNLEYYTGQYWTSLSDLEDLQPYKGGAKPLCVRIPAYYDDLEIGGGNDYTEHDHNVDFDNDELYEYPGFSPDGAGSDVSSPQDEYRHVANPPQGSLERVIRNLLETLQSHGYERSDIKAFTLRDANDQNISTKEWVMKEAEKDTVLTSIILGNAGALQHMVHCLHYDVLWNKKVETVRKTRRSNR